MYNGMFSDENNSGNDISREMSGTGDHHGKQTQPCSERQTPHMQVDAYVWWKLKGEMWGREESSKQWEGGKRLYRVHVV